MYLIKFLVKSFIYCSIWINGTTRLSKFNDKLYPKTLIVYIRMISVGKESIIVSRYKVEYGKRNLRQINLHPHTDLFSSWPWDSITKFFSHCSLSHKVVAYNCHKNFVDVMPPSEKFWKINKWKIKYIFLIYCLHEKEPV